MTVNKIILKVSDLLMVVSDLDGNKWFLVLTKWYELLGNKSLHYIQASPEKLVKMEVCEAYL